MLSLQFSQLLALLVFSFSVARAEAPRTTAPTIGPSRVRVSVLDCSTVRISVHPGNGRGRLLIVSEEFASYASTQPTNGQQYSPSELFAQGDRIQPGQNSFVVSAGPDTVVTVFGFIPGRQYTVTAYEYNTTPGLRGQESFPVYEKTNHRTARALCSIPACMRAEPAKPASVVDVTALTSTSAQLTIAPGDGNGRLVVVGEPGVGLMLPLQNRYYACPANQYGQNGQLKPGAYVISSGNDNQLTVTGLQPETVYQVAVYEFNAGPAHGFPVAYLLSQPPAMGLIMTPALPVAAAPLDLVKTRTAAR